MIPWRLKHALKPLQFAVGLNLVRPQRPSAHALRWLHSGWSNEGWSGDTRYLEQVWRESLKARRILECGSGLSTILMGVVARNTGCEIWSLEHTAEWYEKVNGVLRKKRLPNRVSYAPLKSYGSFDWYELPKELPREFDLVICDGPPSATRGGRYGLVPVCADRLSGATILLDDAERDEEQATLQRWRQEFGLHAQTSATPEGAYATVKWNARTRSGP